MLGNTNRLCGLAQLPGGLPEGAVEGGNTGFPRGHFIECSLVHRLANKHDDADGDQEEEDEDVDRCSLPLGVAAGL